MSDKISEPKTGLALLREPFPAHQISKLPKPTKKDAVKGKCPECGGWHGLPAVHLSYVGHAALTDRLLDCDPSWTWEPLALKDGLPLFDKDGGLWIKLTVCGVTRPGYGQAEFKSYMDIGAREKEVIGDALRNAAMRFGAALDLWHKGDLHGDDNDADATTPEVMPKSSAPAKAPPPTATPEKRAKFLEFLLDTKKVPEAQVLAYGLRFGCLTDGQTINQWNLAKVPSGKNQAEKIANIMLSFGSAEEPARFATDQGNQPSYSEPPEEKSWRDFIFPIKKIETCSGKKLGDLDEKDLKYWAGAYKVKPGNYAAEGQLFRDALDAAIAEKGWQ